MSADLLASASPTDVSSMAASGTSASAPASAPPGGWYWTPGSCAPVVGGAEMAELIARTGEPLVVVSASADCEPESGPEPRRAVAVGGSITDRPGGYRVTGIVPPMGPERLGDGAFCAAHGTEYAYVAGEMANGIATADLVTAVARAGMLGFFGAAGLRADRVDQEISRIAAALPGRVNWGVNLIHAPAEPRAEQAMADLLIARRVPAVSASAFMELTPPVVLASARGLTRDAAGRVHRARRILAKVSRPEVAAAFMAPAPARLLRDLVDRGLLTADEAELAARIPVAEDITVEADSGGHTDNRPLVALLPEILARADAAAHEYGYERPVRVGAAGGLGTPAALAAAFALGAAYVLTGSVNQAAVESGLSADAKRMLADAGTADVAMAPAADMFELGVRLQVLRRGSMFPFRAERLYRIYTAHDSWAEVPEPVRGRVEREMLRAPFDAVWAETRRFWLGREPEQAERGDRDPKHRMALVFRWYLGMASRWAIQGQTDRRADYQIWCGPAMGAFNRWVEGSFLADPARRTAVQIARNLLEGAAAVTRAQLLRGHGLAVPAAAFTYVPRPLEF